LQNFNALHSWLLLLHLRRLLSHRVLAMQFDPELAHHRLEAHEPKALD